MTTTVTVDQLRNLTDRAGMGLTPDEQARLRDGIDRLHAELEHARAEANRWAEAESADAAAGSYAGRAEEAEAAVTRKDAALRDIHATLSRIRNIDPDPPLLDADDAYTRGWQAHQAAVETELVDTKTPAWTPPPPGDKREQLPDHLLSLIRGGIPDYTSTACVTAYTLAVAVHWSHPRRAELGQWADRMHQRCRRNQKFTGQPCICGCHTDTKGN